MLKSDKPLPKSAIVGNYLIIHDIESGEIRQIPIDRGEVYHHHDDEVVVDKPEPKRTYIPDAITVWVWMTIIFIMILIMYIRVRLY